MLTANSSLLASLSLVLLFLARDASAQSTFVFYGLEAAEAVFLTEKGPSVSTTLGADGVATVTGASVTDSFLGHGEFNAVWKESASGVVFSASGPNYAEIMTCSVDRTATHASCTYSNSVSGSGTFTGSFEPTAIPVLATLTAGSAATTTSSSTTSTVTKSSTSTTTSSTTSTTTALSSSSSSSSSTAALSNTSSGSTLTNPPASSTDSLNSTSTTSSPASQTSTQNSSATGYVIHKGTMMAVAVGLVASVAFVI